MSDGAGLFMMIAILGVFCAGEPDLIDALVSYLQCKP